MLLQGPYVSLAFAIFQKKEGNRDPMENYYDSKTQDFRYLAGKLLFLLTTLIVLEGQALMAKDISIGVVDIQRVILTVAEGKEAKVAIEKSMQEKQKEMAVQKEQFDKLEKESKDPLLSNEAKARKQEELQKRYMEITQEKMRFDSEMKQKEMQTTQKIAMKVQELSNKIAKEQALDLVFEANSSGLLYAKNPVDLTPKVLELYDGKEKLAVSDSSAKKPAPK